MMGSGWNLKIFGMLGCWDEHSLKEMSITSSVFSWCFSGVPMRLFSYQSVVEHCLAIGDFFLELCVSTVCKNISLWLNWTIMQIKKLLSVLFLPFFFVCGWLLLFFKVENTKFIQIFCTVHVFQISGLISNCLTDSHLT